MHATETLGIPANAPVPGQSRPRRLLTGALRYPVDRRGQPSTNNWKVQPIRKVEEFFYPGFQILDGLGLVFVHEGA